MGAPKSRGLPRVHYMELPAAPLRNDRVVIVATFAKSGAFEISFAPYQVVGDNRNYLRRIPTLALAKLREQLLVTHDQLWKEARLSANPKIITDLRTLIEGVKKDDMVRPVDSVWRAAYVKALCTNFNAACTAAGVHASMEVAGEPTQKDKPEPAKKAVKKATKKDEATTACPVTVQKVPPKKTVPKKAVKATAKPRKR